MRNYNCEYRGANRRRRGGVLALSLMAVATIAVLAMVMVQVSISATKRQSSSLEQKQAFYLAEAGLTEAFAGLGIGKTGQVGSEVSPAGYGDGLFWVDAEDAGNNLVQLESTGMWGGGRATLGLVAQGTTESVASLGIFSFDGLKMNPDVTVDSFDSALGPYALQIDTPSNYQAVLGSNGDVKLLSGGEVRGDVVHGTAGSADTGTVTITGTVQPRSQAAVMPPIEVPDVGPPASLDHDDLAPLVIPAGEHGFSLFDLGQDTTTLVQGPATLVVEEMWLRKNATLEFDSTNGSIEVFVTGDIDLDLDATVVTTVYDPTGVVFQIASDDTKAVTLGAQSTFYGFLYAPNADIKLGAKFKVYGGLVAKSFDLATQGAVHYDIAIERRLRTLPGRVSWRVVDIPDGIAMKGGDPFHMLGVDKGTLAAPAEAHADQPIDITYIDILGTLTSYTGLESGFDWADVASVVEFLRDGNTVTAPAEWDGGTGVDPSDPEPKDPPVDPADAVMLDLIADPSTTSTDIKNALLDKVPNSEAVLLAAITRDPPMSSMDLYLVFEKEGPYSAGYPDAVGLGPMSHDVLMSAILQSPLSSLHLGWALVQNSPLEADVLQAAIDRVPAMKNPDLTKVLAAQ